MGSAIKFNCLTGLRPNEALQAIRLVKSGHPTISYYNQDRQCLEHFRYPEIFLRHTKSAYISLVDNQLLGIAQSIRKMPTYEAIRYATTRRGLSFHMGYCRKIFASWLRQSGIAAETVDLLQGRVPRTVFARHYFTPSLEYRQKVLDISEQLKQQIEQ
jgi:intergrase/recombinase